MMLGIVLTCVVVFIGGLWWLRSAKMKKKKLLIQNFEKDKVYLVQFPVSPDVRSISPFSLKVETWLKLRGIPYENVYTLKFGPKGQIPYVELNGEQIPDSNVIIARLTEHFKITGESLTPSQDALGHTIVRMVENHTCKGNFLWRYVNQGSEFLPRYFCWISPLRLAITKFMFRKGMPVRMYLDGIGRHSTAEINEFVCQDLKAISDLLGDKDYMLGDAMTTTDCSLFGHLAQFYYVKLRDFPLKDFLVNDCPNLVDYVKRIEAEFWPDWEHDCKQESMVNKFF